MKSCDYRILASVFVALVMVLGAVGWATAQQGNPPVRGSGTPNTIPVWTGSGTIGDSSITQSGSNVSVGGSVSATSFTGDGSGLTNVNASKLGGFSPNAFAQIGTSNTFKGDQTINGNLNLTGSLALPVTTDPNTGVISLGGNPVLHFFGPIFFGGLPESTFVGVNAGNFTMTGSSNTAVGVATLSQNTRGSVNTALGGSALSSNTEGQGNTAVGRSALFSNTTGDNNTAVGLSALIGNISGDNNTAVGVDALAWNTTGQGNTVLGYQAGLNLIGSESENIVIGHGVGGRTGESNAIRIGVANQQSRTFIAGISGATAGLPGARSW
jgi:hypothetical protein